MKGVVVILMIVIGLLMAGGQAGADTLYSTFGPSYFYDTVLGTAIGSYTPAQSPTQQQSVAASFIPSITATLVSIDFAARYMSGLDQLTVQLDQDSAGLPGSVIESYQFGNIVTSPGSAVYAAFSLLTPQLLANTQYWVELTVNDLINTNIQWMDNGLALLGGRAANDAPGFSWVSQPGWVTPAFDVNGTPVSTPPTPPPPGGAVPEPTTMLLLGSGLAGLWGLRRKFKK